MKKHHVCIIADSMDTQYAGIYTYASMLLPALEKTKPPHVEISYLHQRKNAFFAGRREYIVPRVRRYPGADTVRRMLHIPALLRREGCTVVHDLGHIAPFPSKRTSYKKILTIHDLTPLMMPEMHIKRSQVIHKHLFPRLVANADHIITVSEQTKHDVLCHLQPEAPVTAIPLAPKMLSYDGARPHDQPYILSVSTLEPRKNLQQLLDAFTLLKEAGLPHDLVLIGKEGWGVAPLLAAIATSPWKPHIHLLGFVADEDLGIWYRHAAAVVYPSLYEGFGLPILEAFAAGVPTIVTETPASVEVAGDAALMVPVGNAASLERALHRILQDTALATTLGQKGKARAEVFSWEKTARATWEVYTS